MVGRDGVSRHTIEKEARHAQRERDIVSVLLRHRNRQQIEERCGPECG